jgi:hypothetical protein
MANLRRRRRRLNDMLLKAQKEGRLDQVLREMERRARQVLAGGDTARKPRRRAAP